MPLLSGEFHCSSCNLTVNSEQQLNQHFSGSKHREKTDGNFQTVNTDFNARSKQSQNFAVRKVEPMKVQGMNYFVKEGTGTGPNQQIMSGDGNSSPYCVTCHITMTSPAQAQAHYNGSKHLSRVKLLETMTNSDGSNPQANLQAGSGMENSDMFCKTCCVKLTSIAQAQSHYSGARHKAKQKQFEEQMDGSSAGMTNPAGAAPGAPGQDIYCSVCRVQFTSGSQAISHYEGAKHKHKLQLLQEASSGGGTENMEGEPAAKKIKFREICQTCNVVMTCPDMVTAHYNGSKHEKKAALLKAIEDGNLKPLATRRQPHPNQQQRAIGGNGWNTFGSRPIQKQSQRSSQLHCSFCNIQTNSQAQMDAHRTGGKHKMKVEEIAGGGQGAAPGEKMGQQEFMMTPSGGPPPPPPANAGGHPRFNNHSAVPSTGHNPPPPPPPNAMAGPGGFSSFSGPQPPLPPSSMPPAATSHGSPMAQYPVH